jgi:hypothetical protein
MSSFMSDVMQPGGGVMLLPFVRIVIGILLVLTIAGFCAGVARLHMAILAFLSAGLLVSLAVFESEFKKLKSGSGEAVGVPSKAKSNKPGAAAKSD